jgi:hypothetical protein
MNRREMNPLGRPGRSFTKENSNGHPVNKEASWVTRVSQKGTRSGSNEKAYAVGAWASKDLPIDYEACGTCGFDHIYDGVYPGVYAQIKKLHFEADEKIRSKTVKDH